MSLSELFPFKKNNFNKAVYTSGMFNQKSTNWSSHPLYETFFAPGQKLIKKKVREQAGLAIGNLTWMVGVYGPAMIKDLYDYVYARIQKRKINQEIVEIPPALALHFNKPLTPQSFNLNMGNYTRLIKYN